MALATAAPTVASTQPNPLDVEIPAVGGVTIAPLSSATDLIADALEVSASEAVVTAKTNQTLILILRFISLPPPVGALVRA
jgi:hypothetical protein